jgi:hypothetical protein
LKSNSIKTPEKYLFRPLRGKRERFYIAGPKRPYRDHSQLWSSGVHGNSLVRRTTLNHIHRTSFVAYARRAAVLAAAAFLAFLFTSTAAQAGCAVPSRADAPRIPYANPHTNEEWDGGPTIVGLWHVLYTAESDNNFPPGVTPPPTPFQFLESLKTWHADGTEFENAFVPPTGGNICFGVWKEQYDHRIKLHHIGLMFNPDGSISALFTDDEVVSVSKDGKTYTGSFDFRLWPPSYDAVGVGTPISEVKGNIAATRVVVD